MNKAIIATIIIVAIIGIGIYALSETPENEQLETDVTTENIQGRNLSVELTESVGITVP